MASPRHERSARRTASGCAPSWGASAGTPRPPTSSWTRRRAPARLARADHAGADRGGGRVVARAETLKVGDPLDPSTEMGPVVSQAQQEAVAAATGQALGRSHLSPYDLGNSQSCGPKQSMWGPPGAGAARASLDIATAPSESPRGQAPPSAAFLSPRRWREHTMTAGMNRRRFLGRAAAWPPAPRPPPCWARAPRPPKPAVVAAGPPI
ncbi:aldehyde dehydrogenase family protein [Actinomadura madurae]|uniref:aldehyde dehydrogenase family protein n=1 Tax=Actinomadura madurae TaxID=1993 RepID=UPI00355888E9